GGAVQGAPQGGFLGQPLQQCGRRRDRGPAAVAEAVDAVVGGINDVVGHVKAQMAGQVETAGVAHHHRGMTQGERLEGLLGDARGSGAAFGFGDQGQAGVEPAGCIDAVAELIAGAAEAIDPQGCQPGQALQACGRRPEPLGPQQGRQAVKVAYWILGVVEPAERDAVVAGALLRRPDAAVEQGQQGGHPQGPGGGIEAEKLCGCLAEITVGQGLPQAGGQLITQGLPGPHQVVVVGQHREPTGP
ncbi:MAG: hypothetical protein EBX50_22465, partial [Chitinophagia bacterium]|nr:hypothetical protein [Chitinophagia bacterium]